MLKKCNVLPQISGILCHKFEKSDSKYGLEEAQMKPECNFKSLKQYLDQCDMFELYFLRKFWENSENNLFEETMVSIVKDQLKRF